MICYASRTGTIRNLAALRARGWGLLVSRAGKWRTHGFERWAADNGAWTDHQAGRPFDEDRYEKFLGWVETQKVVPAWCVLPDVVAGGRSSLELSSRYLNRCLAVAPLVLLPVQNGMVEADIAAMVGPNVGVFLGGTTEWKLETMARWGVFCARHRVHYHVARVNTTRRMFAAIAAGAHSVDGSSASRYATNLPKLDGARRHIDLFGPDGQPRAAGQSLAAAAL